MAALRRWELAACQGGQRSANVCFYLFIYLFSFPWRSCLNNPPQGFTVSSQTAGWHIGIQQAITLSSGSVKGYQQLSFLEQCSGEVQMLGGLFNYRCGVGRPDAGHPPLMQSRKSSSQCLLQSTTILLYLL